jgi:hypothetical protein
MKDGPRSGPKPPPANRRGSVRSPVAPPTRQTPPTFRQYFSVSNITRLGIEQLAIGDSKKTCKRTASLAESGRLEPTQPGPYQKSIFSG